jgi:N-methylhydantoinase B
MFDRVHHPARGREGGQSGAAGQLSSLARNQALSSKGQHPIPVDDVLRLELPGGGGFGQPYARHADMVADDVSEGLVTTEAARDVYGVVLTADGRPDIAATAALRGAPISKVA